MILASLPLYGALIILQACCLASSYLRSHAHVHLLVASLDDVGALRYLLLVHVDCIVRVTLACPERSHQDIICFVSRFLHLAISAEHLIVVLICQELQVLI